MSDSNSVTSNEAVREKMSADSTSSPICVDSNFHSSADDGFLRRRRTAVAFDMSEQATEMDWDEFMVTSALTKPTIPNGTFAMLLHRSDGSYWTSKTSRHPALGNGDMERLIILLEAGSNNNDKTHLEFWGRSWTVEMINRDCLQGKKLLTILFI
eukprot:GHVL01017568.1.p1 GENE.GHVL01017568.1~~GHVL01017568.1.p1  ORF type:complete len:155 (+),score=25.45 GHVL01017568.1:85-549(+)